MDRRPSTMDFSLRTVAVYQAASGDRGPSTVDFSSEIPPLIADFTIGVCINFPAILVSSRAKALILKTYQLSSKSKYS